MPHCRCKRTRYAPSPTRRVMRTPMTASLSFGDSLPPVMSICGSVADRNSDATSTTTVTAASVLVPVAKANRAATTWTWDGDSSHTATDSNGASSHPPHRHLRQPIHQRRMPAAVAITRSRGPRTVTRLCLVSHFPLVPLVATLLA